MDLARDLRAMIQDDPSPVLLAGGRTLNALAGVASGQPDLGGESIVAGRTRTLLFATEDVEDLKQGDTLTWKGKPWRVLQLGLFARGAGTKAFLGAP